MSQQRQLGDLVKLTSGKSPSSFRFAADGIPYFKVDQLGKSSKYLTNSDTPYFAKESPTVPARSVLIAKRGAAIALDRVRIIRQSSFMDTNVMALTPTDELDGEYLFYWLAKRGLWDIADVTSVPQINNKHINPLQITLPPLRDQRKVVNHLSDVDSLIDALERLISKKRAIKQGVIQKIVSDLQGETRTLGNIGVTIRGVSYNPSTDLRSSPGIDSVDLFRANNVQGSRLDFSDMQYISARRPRMDQFLQEDDILICSANGSKRLVGKAALVGQLPRESTFGAFMMVYRPDPDLIDPIFAALQFQTRPFRDWIDVLLSGSSINNLRPRDVTSFEIVLPSSDEQREIAQIIRDIDAEIDALERRLESARNIKQGMMQELLTGRTRLPIEEVSS